MPSFDTKSALDRARQTARLFAPTEVGERRSWRVMAEPSWVRGKLWQRRITRRANRFVRSFSASEVVLAVTNNLQSEICNLKCTQFDFRAAVTFVTKRRPATVNFPFRTTLIASVYAMCSCFRIRAASACSSSASNTGTVFCTMIAP